MSFKEIFNLIVSNNLEHSRESAFYKDTEKYLDEIVANSEFAEGGSSRVNLGFFGEITFPFINMGSINSLHLFGLDEMIIFAYYFISKDKYKNVSDIGSNIGLHSLLMSKCGWNVEAFEPDPNHVKIIENNLSINSVTTVRINQVAVSNLDGETEFIRVLGNTTGSHIAGAKDNAYGELERFKVKVVSAKEIFKNSDLIKMDVEGEEANIIASTTKDDWLDTDMILEVGTEVNATIIFEHLKAIGINMFSQKNGWGLAETLADVPASYKEGSLFVSTERSMNWR